MAEKEVKEVKKVDVEAFKARKLKAINTLASEAKKRVAAARIQANK